MSIGSDNWITIQQVEDSDAETNQTVFFDTAEVVVVFTNDREDFIDYSEIKHDKDANFDPPLKEEPYVQEMLKLFSQRDIIVQEANQIIFLCFYIILLCILLYIM